jgi:prophage regulatory protein
MEKPHHLPETGYFRIWHILGDKNAEPPIPPLIPISKSTWWSGIKSGRFPAPVKLAPNISAWRIKDISELMESWEEQANEKI